MTPRGSEPLSSLFELQLSHVNNVCSLVDSYSLMDSMSSWLTRRLNPWAKGHMPFPKDLLDKW
jgi:hypothetical protein